VSVVNIAQTRILALTGLIEAKSSITSPIQEALKITGNHNGRVAMQQLFTSTQKNTDLHAVDKQGNKNKKK